MTGPNIYLRWTSDKCSTLEERAGLAETPWQPVPSGVVSLESGTSSRTVYNPNWSAKILATIPSCCGAFASEP